MTQFEYDYDNRLVRIVYPNGGEVRFGYDGLGRRVWRQDGNSVRYFFYDGDRIIAERESNAWVVRYLLGLKPCGFMANGQVHVYHADRLGSVRWVTDGSQNILVSYIYEGFGKIIGQNGGGGGAYQFCGLWGYRNDLDAGLLHVGARYYEVETGRWVQAWFTSPLEAEHRFTYVRNNPIIFVDPKGNPVPVLVVGGVVVGIVGGALLDYVEDSELDKPWMPVVGGIGGYFGGGIGAAVIGGRGTYITLIRLGQIALTADHYTRGGGGINLRSGGDRLIGIDWHHIPTKWGRFRLPHIDIPGRVKHWPWPEQKK